MGEFRNASLENNSRSSSLNDEKIVAVVAERNRQLVDFFFLQQIDQTASEFTTASAHFRGARSTHRGLPAVNGQNASGLSIFSTSSCVTPANHLSVMACGYVCYPAVLARLMCST